MARINFVTSYRNRMMKTPICIHLASRIGAPIIDADFDGNHMSRISKLMEIILELSNRKRLSVENYGFIGLWFQQMVFNPMWVEIENNQKETRLDLLPDLLESIYQKNQRIFKVTYKAISPRFQSERFHVPNRSKRMTNRSQEIFIDCPGAAIRFDSQSFIKQLEAIRERLDNIEISLYHVVDYNSVLNTMKPIPDDRDIAHNKLIFLSNAFKKTIDVELKDTLKYIDDIVLIINFFEFKKKFIKSLFGKIRIKSAHDDLKSISSSQEPISLYNRIDKLREIYRLKECPHFSEWTENKYKNVYNFLRNSKDLKRYLVEVEVDKR